MNPLFYCWRAFAIQDRQNRWAKRIKGALAWLLVVEQEMGQFVRQCKALLFVSIARVNKDRPLPLIRQQASMQAAISPRYTMRDLDTPRPPQDVSDAQSGNRVDLQRQPPLDRRLHIATESPSSTCHRPELL